MGTRELPKPRETAACPTGSWPCSSPDILGNVELFESKGNKSFANVNTNDCGKGLVLKEKLRILGAYWVIFLAGNNTRLLLWEWWRQSNSCIFNGCSYCIIFNCPRLIKLLFESFWLLLCHVLLPFSYTTKFANLPLWIHPWIQLYHIFFEHKESIASEVYTFDYMLCVS